MPVAVSALNMGVTIFIVFMLVGVSVATMQVVSVLYPAIFGGCRFFEEHSEEKNHCAAREFGAVL